MGSAPMADGVLRVRLRHPSHRRVIVCPIADAAVRVTLRSGSHIGEPRRPYVRCEERDCQYVDRNEPPCPLSLEMFADCSDALVEESLATAAGTWVCYECLGEATGITRDDVRDALRRLAARAACTPAAQAGPASLELGHARCARCRRRNRAAYLRVRSLDQPVPDVALSTSKNMDGGREHDEFVRAMLSAPDVALCERCLAFVIHQPLGETRRTLEALRGDSRFVACRAECAKCRRIAHVIRTRTTPR